MKKFRLYFATYWRPFLMFVVAASILSFISFYKIGNLVPGLSTPEKATIKFSSSLDTIKDTPIEAPITLTQYVLQKYHQATPATLRAISAFVGLLVVLAFYLVAKRWFSSYVAFLGTFLLACSSWLLHSSRLATPLILQALLIIPIALGVWLQRNRGGRMFVLTSSILVATLLYIPGFIWFVLLGIFWQRRRFLRAVSARSPLFVVLCVALFGILLMPLTLAFVIRPELLRIWAGLPDHLPAWTSLLRNFASVPLNLFWHGPDKPVYWLSPLPLLEFFSSIMLLIGIYSFWSRRLLDRVRILFGTIIVGWALITLGGVINIVILLPVVFLLIANGIDFLLEQWQTVFPRNPLARSLGFILLTLCIGIVLVYQLTSYFKAWPANQSTKAAFNNQQLR